MEYLDDYGALEPYISAEIMELHHSKHHQTYVNGLNSALETIGEAESKGDFTKAATVAPLLNFHGGGHLNHSLFGENLAPASKEGGGDPDGALKVRSPALSSNFPLPPICRTNADSQYRKLSTRISDLSMLSASRQTPRWPESREAAGRGW